MRMVEVVFSEFMSQLKAAGHAGGRIEKHQKDKWKAYVTENGVFEAAVKVHAKALAEPLKTVIINTGGDWDGYYIYSPGDEIALKFEKS